MPASQDTPPDSPGDPSLAPQLGAGPPRPGGYSHGSGYQPGYYGYYPMVPKTNSYAIASLVLSIVMLCGIGSILGIVFGVRARKEIAASGGAQTGDGLALAGIIVGIVTLALGILYLVVMLAMIFFVGSTAMV